MRRLYASLVLLTVILSVGALPVTAQNDDLQDYINSVSSGSNGVSPQTRATTSDGFTIVDLSQFSATNRTTTLQVTNGQKLRFVNGTLSSTSELKGPLVLVGNESAVEVASLDCTSKTGASFEGGLVRLNNGTLRVKDYGNINALKTSSNKSGGPAFVPNIPIEIVLYRPVVEMTGVADKFYLEDNGWINGLIVNEKETGRNNIISISGGNMYYNDSDSGEIKTTSDVLTTGKIGTPVNIELLETGNVLKLSGLVETNFKINVATRDIGDKVAEGIGYTLTENDYKNIAVYNGNDIWLNTKIKNNAIYINEYDDIQEFIDHTPTNASGYKGKCTDVDLLKFSNTRLSKTLNITGRRNIRFINGELTRSADLNAPLMQIDEGSGVIVASRDSNVSTRAVIKDDNLKNIELIRLNDGHLFVENYGWVSAGYSTAHNQYDNSVLIEHGEFILRDNGWVSGPIVGNSTNSSIHIEGGSMFTGSSDFGTIDAYSDVYAVGDVWLHVNLLGKDNHVLLCSPLKGEMQITAPAKTYNDVIVSGVCLIRPIGGYPADYTYYQYGIGQDDFSKIKFVNDKGMGIYLIPAEGFIISGNIGYVRISIDDLQSFIDNLGDDDSNGKGTEDDPHKGYIPCSGIDVNSDVNFNGDDLQYYLLYGKMPAEEGQTEEDCEGTVRQNDGDVYIDKGSTVTFKEIYWHGCGCSHYIYVSGTLIIDIDVHIYNYLRFIHVLPGGRVIIRGLNGEVVDEVIYVDGGTVEYHGGDTSGGKYGWYCAGGVIYIYDGTIKGGTCGGYTGKGGTTYIYGGTVYGGIINYGTTYIHGGTVSGGSRHTIYNYKGGKIYIYGGTCSGTGTVWNEGDLYLDGGNSVSISDVYVIRGCHIYILSRLTYILRLHITVENIVLNTPIILGGDGYRLTEEDCGKLQIDLPDGYAWRFDQSTGGIIIYSTTGIDGVDTDAPKVVDTFDMTGRKLGEARKGINVERMSDGTVRKVVVK